MERDDRGRFAPGNTLGAAGRPPKGQSLTDILREALEDTSAKRDHRAMIAAKLIELAEDGEMDAIKYVYNRVDGMPHESKTIDGTVDTRLTVVPWE